MSELVERAERAFCEAIGKDFEGYRGAYEKAIRAAIEAMREPTTEMVAAGDSADYCSSEGVNLSRLIDEDGIAIVYRAMIEAALK